MARVLVIEDNPASLDLMVYLLKAFGHSPLLARDGLQGLEVARVEKPDLILCDIQLPGADGVEVCRQLKSDPVLCEIPVVAVTAYAMVGDRERLLGENFNGYMSKPINPQTFMEEMTPYLNKSQAKVMKSFNSEKQVSVRKHEGTILVVDNSPVNVRLARSMLEPFGYQVIEAKGVDEALNVLARSKPDAILSDLHMPVRDGIDFIREVKADDDLRQIPFIFISSTVWGDRERDHGLSLGAASFLIRPIEPQALVEEIESLRVKRNGQ